MVEIYPSSSGMSRTMIGLGSVFSKVLRDGQTKKEGNASNEKVSH
jgi:hypothetical protein